MIQFASTLITKVSTYLVSSMLVLVMIPIAAIAQDQANSEQQLSFNRDIRSILSNTCYQCHGPDKKDRQADLRLDKEEGIVAAFRGDQWEESEAWQRIISADDDIRMPPPDSHKSLTAEEKETLRVWIFQGAQWQGHWSFITPTKPSLPIVKKPDWVQQPIDAFVLAKLESIKLQPAERAEKQRLLRRVSFDLTGFPPTIAEVDNFLNDNSPDAYERAVDRLLSSPRFGERLALEWMDAARYGDSSVFHADGPRDMWAWRDWVIKAFNDNMPYDQFTVDQLAGDLLPNATYQQQIASGFNRNHGTSDEGGSIDEELRVEYIVDRIKTTSTVWLGLTMECAQCHDHKYDPISQREYYQMFAFFNQSSDKGMQSRNGNADPKIDVPNEKNLGILKSFQAELADSKTKLAQHVKNVEPQFEAWHLKASNQLDANANISIPENALVYFALDEQKGNQAVNAEKPETKATVHGKQLWEAGKFNNGFRFDGSNFIDAGNIADFERTDNFSYGAWIKYNKGQNGAPIGKMDGGNNYRGFDIHLSNGKVEFHLINKWPENAIKVTSKGSFPADQWHHVFVTYDGSSKQEGVKIYIDGKPQQHDVNENRLSATTKTDKPLRIGRRFNSSIFRGSVDDVRIYDRCLSDAEVAALAGQDPIKPILAVEPAKRTAEQVNALRNHYLQNFDDSYQQLIKQQSQLQSRIGELSKPLTTVMVMRDLPKPRMTYILDRGNYASPKKDEELKPDTIAALPALGAASRNRLGMAQWLVRSEHPLTARVTVNRYWQMFFGTGIVETTEDFGAQGSWPTHLDLLDWLAVDFVEHGWDVKRLVKQIVMSSTYQQTSRLNPQLLDKDPKNRLLTRGPRFRLMGEFIRDNALNAGGMLVETLGGPSVKPVQPDGLWNEVSLNGGLRFKPDAGEKLYRRSMYTYWKRSAPAPNLTIMGTPTREKCVVRRAKTNTPLQALVTLNDPQFVESARMLGQRMITEGGESIEARIEFGYRTATGLKPNATTIDVLKQAFVEELVVFQQDNERAKQLVAIGQYPRDESLDVAELAAYSVVASIIFNLDESLTRG